jgi:hypothetical protein
MSPASYLTAPPRVAASIVAPQGPEDTVVTMPRMPLLTWLCLVFFLAALIGSGAFAAVHGLRTWRAARVLSGGVEPEIDRISRGAERAEAQAARISDGSARLALAVERLQHSRAQLEILRDATARARATLDPRRAFPRK